MLHMQGGRYKKRPREDRKNVQSPATIKEAEQDLYTWWEREDTVQYVVLLTVDRVKRCCSSKPPVPKVALLPVASKIAICHGVLHGLNHNSGQVVVQLSIP